MSAEFTFENVCPNDNPVLDIIFVHGLTGDAKETWKCTSDNTFWPTWLSTDLEHVSIYTLGYPASVFAKWAKKEMDIFERAGNVLEYLAAKGVGTRPIAFVTHSLGGILTKILIRKAAESNDEDYTKISDTTRLVMFLATPHTGAVLANVLNALPGVSKNIALLANDIGFLEDLNSHYCQYANSRQDLSTKVYYEKHATKGAVLVVSRESASIAVAGCQPTAVDKDHISICKPSNKEDIVYLGVKRHIEKLHRDVVSESAQGKIDPLSTDYSIKAAEDRRDLLQKLIDAGREHEYSYANSAQNEFARNFAKTGLFTNAREDREKLLSEVETRFVSHVFHPLICKGAADEKIRAAIQDHIIDPLCGKDIGTTRFPAKTVFSALYFLTEQCHIKWDYTS